MKYNSNIIQMEKEVNYKPTHVNKKFISNFEQTYNHKKKRNNDGYSKHIKRKKYIKRKR